MFDSVTPWTAACQTSLSITNSQSSLKLTSIESVMSSNHLILCCSLPLPPSVFPTSGSFPMSQLFTWGGQSIGVSASASFLPKNTQDWSPSKWTGWISLQSKGLLKYVWTQIVLKAGLMIVHRKKDRHILKYKKTLLLTFLITAFKQNQTLCFHNS